VVQAVLSSVSDHPTAPAPDASFAAANGIVGSPPENEPVRDEVVVRRQGIGLANCSTAALP
jgi:hypothetical protein